MATAYQIQVNPHDTGLWKVNQSDEAAKKTSDLLQQDLKDHHVFFNEDHFHNHIPHHILTLFGTGAGPQSLQKGYDGNAGYQRNAKEPHDRVPEELKDWDHAKQYLGKEQYYPDFLVFFQREIEKDGWEKVMNEYVFKGDERADDMLVRLFAGFVHPLIQLMFGMEWKQPAIVAEALAQASVHNTELREFHLETEKRANNNASNSTPSVVSLFDAIRQNKKILAAPQMKDANKVRDGVLVRAKEEMFEIASRVKVRPEELEEKTIEMFNACVYAAAGAAIHPPKHVKFDFFLMHHVNSAPIFLTVNNQPWISTENKVRLLEWKIRVDLIQYAGRASSPLSVDAIAGYKPKSKTGISSPQDLLSRLHDLDDDGHAIKLARATAVCQTVSKKYEDKEWMKVKGDDLWMNIHHMIVDSVEEPGQRWVRTAGLEEAWEDIVDQPKL